MLTRAGTGVCLDAQSPDSMEQLLERHPTPRRDRVDPTIPSFSSKLTLPTPVLTALLCPYWLRLRRERHCRGCRCVFTSHLIWDERERKLENAKIERDSQTDELLHASQIAPTQVARKLPPGLRERVMDARWMRALRHNGNVETRRDWIDLFVGGIPVLVPGLRTGTR